MNNSADENTQIAIIFNENVRLRHVIAKADSWRQTLNLPQQDLGCSEFNQGFEDYDTARDEISDLIPHQMCKVSDCTELSFLDGLCEYCHPEF